MKTRQQRKVTVRYTWDRLRVSFWFAPAVMAVGAVLLAWIMYWIDGRIPNEILRNSRFVLSGSPGEIRTMLLGMAEIILATAGVVFTLLTLPLSTVAAQYGSRLLPRFPRRPYHPARPGHVCGCNCLLFGGCPFYPVGDVVQAGPQVTATVGIFLMLGSFASLILLVQHISTMLQAPNIAAAAGAELVNVVRAEIPEQVTSAAARAIEPGTDIASLVETDSFPVILRKPGYIQYIDPDGILTLAQEHNLVIRLLHKPGHFVGEDARVALVWPASRVDAELERQIRSAFRVGNMRTPTQDIAYAVDQLVEMSVRAMSPAINDPFTAMTCLDHIGEGLALFLRQGEKSSRYYDQNNRLLLILEPVTFTELLDDAFDMLRHCSCDNASVLQHMLAVIEVISRDAASPEARQELLRHVDLDPGGKPGRRTDRAGPPAHPAKRRSLEIEMGGA